MEHLGDRRWVPRRRWLEPVYIPGLTSQQGVIRDCEAAAALVEGGGGVAQFSRYVIQ